MIPKRIQLKRTKGWRKPPNTVVVSRPTKWGNPFSWQDLADILERSNPKAVAVDEFTMWINGKPPYAGLFEGERQCILDHIHELRGKNLACWCKLGEPCHADVLLKLANKIKDGE